MPEITVTIYHNPACGTSRNLLALIRHAGIEPTIIEYLKNPPGRPLLMQLTDDAGDFACVKKITIAAGTSAPALAESMNLHCRTIME